MKTTKIIIGFKNKRQAPLFMVIKEFYNDGNLYFAKSLFEIWLPITAKKFGIKKLIRINL